MALINFSFSEDHVEKDGNIANATASAEGFAAWAEAFAQATDDSASASSSSWAGDFFDFG